MINVRWIGAAGLEFTYEGRTILVDPYLTRVNAKALSGPLVPDRQRIQAYRNEIPGKLTAVIVGHTHFDHALDIPEIAGTFEGPLLGSQSLKNRMTFTGGTDRVVTCRGGEQIELFPGATVTMLVSEHGIVNGSVPSPGEIRTDRPPQMADEYKLGTIFITCLKLGKISFMLAGSAGFRPENLDGHTADVLFMCVPGWKLAPHYTSRLPEMAKPKIIIPYHFDNFFRPLDLDGNAPELPDLDLEGFRESVLKSAPNVEFRKVRLFSTMEF